MSIVTYDLNLFSDRVKLYASPLMDPDRNKYSLQNKVQFDIRFYFCRRGAENMHKMMKSMFEVRHDYQLDCDYVIKVEDKATKNHCETDQLIITNFMPENKTDKMCPVRSFRIYIDHLNPQNPYLWQTPNPNVKDENNNKIWYTLGHIWKNPLGAFMSTLSEQAKLSKKYTNHSIRVTGASILTRCKYNDKEVMSMTGHKSVQSLTIYQPVQNKKKIEMGQVLQKSLSSDDDTLIKAIQNPVPPKQAIAQSPQQAIEAPKQLANENIRKSNAVVPFEPNFDDDDLAGIDWLQVLCDAENSTKQLQDTARDTSVSNTLMHQRNSPMFANCKIGNININITKK